MNILYIILKHVIWRFQIYNLFREIFKFREDNSNNVFREIRKCFRKSAKFEFHVLACFKLTALGRRKVNTHIPAREVLPMKAINMHVFLC